MSMSNYLEEELLDQVFNNLSAPAITTPYISLHTADPGETGASECTGGSYARQAGSFGAASGGASISPATILPGLPSRRRRDPGCGRPRS